MADTYAIVDITEEILLFISTKVSALENKCRVNYPKGDASDVYPMCVADLVSTDSLKSINKIVNDKSLARITVFDSDPKRLDQIVSSVKKAIQTSTMTEATLPDMSFSKRVFIGPRLPAFYERTDVWKRNVEAVAIYVNND